MAYDVDQLIATARKRLESARASEGEVRKEAKIDKLFLVGKQWGEGGDGPDLKKTRITQGRAALTINRLSAFRNQVVNDIRQNNPQARVSPRRDGTKETAEVYEGLIRAIQYDSNATLAFMEAAKYAVGSSYGVFELVAELDEDEEHYDLKVEPIFDPDTVFFDPHALQPDRKDARWAIKLVPMSRVDFKTLWPNATANISNFAEGPPDWMDPHGDGEHVMVAEYWCVEVAGTSDVALGGEDEDRPVRKRKEKGFELIKHIITGSEELEKPTLHPGKRVPFFPVYGDETWVEGKRYIGSLIRDAREIQVLYNWEATNEAETLAMAPRNPYLVTPRNVQNHEKVWHEMNNTNRNYVLFNPDPENPGGPRRDWNEPPIQAISAAKAQTAGEMRDVIGLHDPSLGKQQYAGQSGRAIAQLRAQGDTSTFHYADNLRRAIESLGHSLLEWIPWYIDTEQEITILGEDMAEKIIRVNTEQPHTDADGNTYHHQLSVGKYQLVVKIGPSNDTVREEESEFWDSTVSAFPEGMLIFGDQYFSSKDIAGSDIAAERMKRFIAMKTPGLIEDQNSNIPPEVQAQMAQMQAQLQQQQQALEQAGLIIKTKQIEAQGRLAVEQEKGRNQILKTSIEAQSSLDRAKIDHQGQLFEAKLEALIEAARHLSQMHHEHAMVEHKAEATKILPLPPPEGAT